MKLKNLYYCKEYEEEYFIYIVDIIKSLDSVRLMKISFKDEIPFEYSISIRSFKWTYGDIKAISNGRIDIRTVDKEKLKMEYAEYFI